MEKTEWINGVLDAYCAESGDLPRSTSHLSPLEEWLLKKLWDNENSVLKRPNPRMTEDELDEYLHGVCGYLSKNLTQRVGQAYFNYLAQIRPELAEQIRDGGLDPFHNDSVIPELLKWLKGEIDL